MVNKIENVLCIYAGLCGKFLLNKISGILGFLISVSYKYFRQSSWVDAQLYVEMFEYAEIPTDTKM